MPINYRRLGESIADAASDVNDAATTRLSKLKAANELIRDDDVAMSLLLKAHKFSKSPEAKLRLALKFGIPVAGLTGLLIGGSKFNRESMPQDDDCTY